MSKNDRNGPCPCGSGKKYKRCCLSADRGAQAALREPDAHSPLVAAAVQEARAWAEEADTDAIIELLTLIGDLAGTTGPLAPLRFPEDALISLLAAQELAPGEVSADELAHRLAPQLVQPEWLLKARAHLAQLLDDGEVPVEHQRAVAFALLTTRHPIDPRYSGLDLAESVLCQMLFEGAEAAGDAPARELLEDALDGLLTPDEFRSRALAGHPGALGDAVIELALDLDPTAIEPGLASLDGPSPPGLLTWEEFEWCRLEALCLAERARGEDDQDVAHLSLVLEAQLVADERSEGFGWLNPRALALALAADTTEVLSARVSLALAAAVAPFEVIRAWFENPERRLMTRSEEEDALVAAGVSDPAAFCVLPVVQGDPDAEFRFARIEFLHARLAAERTASGSQSAALPAAFDAPDAGLTELALYLRPPGVIDWRRATAGLPVVDLLDDVDLDYAPERVVAWQRLESSLRAGTVHRWEAALLAEQWDGLAPRDVDAGERVLEIDGEPRPSRPWYETLEPLAVAFLWPDEDGGSLVVQSSSPSPWPDMVALLADPAMDGLSLPRGAANALDAVPLQLRQLLWVQALADAVRGIDVDDPEDAERRCEQIAAWRNHVLPAFAGPEPLTIEEVLDWLPLDAARQAAAADVLRAALALPPPKAKGRKRPGQGPLSRGRRA